MKSRLNSVQSMETSTLTFNQHEQNQVNRQQSDEDNKQMSPLISRLADCDDDYASCDNESVAVGRPVSRDADHDKRALSNGRPLVVGPSASNRATLLLFTTLALLCITSCLVCAIKGPLHRFPRQDTPTTTIAPAEAPSGATAKSKIPAVNYTQVNELFEAVFDDNEVANKWQHMDKQLTDG